MNIVWADMGSLMGECYYYHFVHVGFGKRKKLITFIRLDITSISSRESMQLFPHPREAGSVPNRPRLSLK